MRRKLKIFEASLVLLWGSCILAPSPFALADTNSQKVDLSLVNASEQTICIQDNNGNHCTSTPTATFQISPQYFYERGGVIRISIGNSPLKIAMLKKDITNVSLYVDASGKLHIPSGMFETGSFTYSDNRDYLYFVAKPNALFSAYPV
jgi:hypothetical protein